MAFAQTLQQLIDGSKVARVLSQGSGDLVNVGVLQAGLRDLGFTLDAGATTDAAGIYGAGTTGAVKQFASRNGNSGDGTKVTAALARLLIARHNFLDDLRHLRDAVKQPSTLRKLYRNSPERVSVTVMQEVLNELGYGEQLNWKRYGADGQYGRSTAAAVSAFAAASGLESDGSRVTDALAKAALDRLVGGYGDAWHEETPLASVERLTIKRSNRRVTVSDGENSKTFGIYKQGVYTVGAAKAQRFIETGSDTLTGLGLTPSAINVMLSVSDNEGNLDAINTWDNSFLTFGMFQWTIGQGAAEGELPALLRKIKLRDPGVFERCYGRYGMDVDPRTGEITGRLTLNGTSIRSADQKEILRSDRWAFYFWKSGQDPVVQAVQVEHAMARLRTFYRAANQQVAGRDIGDVITSEYGVALILDNHVNRPAYVKPCLQRAVDQVGPGADPSRWSTADEAAVIDAYLAIRITYGRTPMTDAAKRAQVTRRYLDQGRISAERGSFKAPA